MPALLTRMSMRPPQDGRRLTGQRARGFSAPVQFRHHEVCAAAARTDTVYDLRAALGAAARDDDVRSLGGERLRDRAPDVAGGPSHQGRLVLQSPSHELL